MAADKIFVCYRRDDTEGHAGRLYDRLEERFPGRVFMDVASVGVGTRWAEVIDSTLQSCGAAVILIGKRWLAPGPDGRRRIDAADDTTRAEITTALRLNLEIVPVLVSDALLPSRSDVPPDVAPILDWQALHIDEEDYDHDVVRLIRALEDKLHAARGDVPVGSGDRDEPIRRLDGTPPRTGLGRPVLLGAVAAILIAVVGSNLLRDDETPAENVDSYVEVPRNPAQPEASPVQSSGAVASPAGGTPSSREPLAQPPPAPAQPSLNGDYALMAYAVGGVPQPVGGGLRLVEVGPGSYQFSGFGTVPSMGVTYQYQGLMQNQGAQWTSRLTQSTDPNAIFRPLVTQVAFDGVTLILRNELGQTWMWQKQ
jgi:hypothetical protein